MILIKLLHLPQKWQQFLLISGRQGPYGSDGTEAENLDKFCTQYKNKFGDQLTVFDSVVESKNITTIYAMHQKLLNMPCRNDTEQFYLLEILFIYIYWYLLYIFHHYLWVNWNMKFFFSITIWRSSTLLVFTVNLQFRYFNSLISWVLFQVVWVEVQINFIAKLHIIDWAIIPHVFSFEDLRIFDVHLQT